MRFTILYLLVTLIFSSCSTTTRVKTLPMQLSLETEINEKGKNNSAEILLTDEQTIFAKDLFVIADSVRFVNLEDSSHSFISLENVKKIRFVDHLEGALLGMATGGLFLRIMAHIIANAITESYSYNGQIYIIGGAILGTVVGGVNGIHRNYEFVKNIEIVK
jgi:hypothetical protein